MYKYVNAIEEKSQLTRRTAHHLVIYQWYEQEDHVVMICEKTRSFFYRSRKHRYQVGKERERGSIKSLSIIKEWKKSIVESGT